MIWLVQRKPVLMEDEGRSHLLRAFPTKEEAEAYVEGLSKESGGYFRPEDYRVDKVEDGQ